MAATFNFKYRMTRTKINARQRDKEGFTTKRDLSVNLFYISIVFLEPQILFYMCTSVLCLVHVAHV